MAEKEISRRDFIKKSALLGSSVVVGGSILKETPSQGDMDKAESQGQRLAQPVKKVELAIGQEIHKEDEQIEWLPDEVKQLWPVIKSESEKFGLDTRLIAIIITEESGGLNVANTEGSGASGPMQLMPIAMEEYRQKSGDEQYRDINNPGDNIHVGCWLVNVVNENYIKSSGIDMYSDLGILMLAVGYGDGIGALSDWQKGGMQRSHLSQQAINVSRIWTGMWHEKDQPSSPTLKAERGYNT